MRARVPNFGKSRSSKEQRGERHPLGHPAPEAAVAAAAAAQAAQAAAQAAALNGGIYGRLPLPMTKAGVHPPPHAHMWHARSYDSGMGEYKGCFGEPSIQNFPTGSSLTKMRVKSVQLA